MPTRVLISLNGRIPPPPAQPQVVDFPMSLLQEALDACDALARRVKHLEYEKVAQALEITKLKRRVKQLERGNKVKVLKLRILKKGRMINELDRDEGVALIDDEGVKKKAEEAQVAGNDQVKGRQAEIYQIDMDHASKVLSMHEDEQEVQEVVDVVTTAKLITEVVTAAIRVAAASIRIRKGVVIRDPEEESSAIIPADTKSKDKGKGIMVEEPKPMKKKQQVEMDEEYARKLHEELNKDIDWNVAIDHVKQKAKEDPYVQRYQEEENRAIQSINKTPAQKAAKRKKLNEEVEDLKQHLEIVPDEDDDVYSKATPLARKVPVVDYEIIHFNNKPHYKIIRADGTHQLYKCLKDQMDKLKSRRIKGLSMLILLVEKRYLLSRFTLDQMLNALRLRVEEQSEMSLELLRFTRQQHQEGLLE
nr:hypothetical protein [Tanacetum cinerariifolium]